LVHRDIKPPNVMLSRDSTGRTVLKLIDFGIAADHLNKQQTSVMRGGSIGYAAPEQWVKAGKELNGRTDLYSLGASMYRMLCGKMPYDANDIGDWIEQVKKGPPIAPSQLREDVPKELSDLILELLAFRPEGRPADAATVIRRLGAIHMGSQKPHPPTQREAPVKTIRREGAPAPRTRWPIWAGAAGLAAALSVAGWFAIGNKEQPPPTNRACASYSLRSS
jgi:serine/threonine protein kinase